MDTEEQLPLPKIEIRMNREGTWDVTVHSMTGGTSFNEGISEEEVVRQVEALMANYGYQRSG